MVKRLIGAAALAVVALAAPAAAQQYPPAVNSLTISDSTPCPGQTVTIDARTFAEGSTVSFTLLPESVALASAAADAAGVAAVQATIPTNTPLGAHTITADGTAPDGSSLSTSVSLSVVSCEGTGAGGAGAGGTGGNLPKTGDDASLPLAKVGLGLAALGGVVLAIAAKRRKSALAA
jgi:LPXTG-motif cell wall-anchored protein